MRKRERRSVNLDKAAKTAAIINGAQILFALGLTCYALFGTGFHLSGNAERWLVALMACVVIWGAVIDINDAFNARKIAEQSDMLEDAYGQLEELNATLRKQRHDFKNQLQVVHGLIELGDHAEAGQYIETVYDDIQKVSSVLRTGIPAVNALIAAKMSDCESRGVEMQVEIFSAWKQLPVEGYVICRVMGNLLDNAIDAVAKTRGARIRLELSETLADYTFYVENNGPQIPAQIRGQLFERGFTTKRTGTGMGLAIVKELLEECGGSVQLESADGCTRFSCKVPKGGAAEAAQLNSSVG